MAEYNQTPEPESQAPLRGQGIDPNLFERDTFTQFQTWLSETRSSEGCPVGCTYCFFKLDGQTPKRPEITMTPEATVASIANAPTYHPDMPIHFGSQTDAFSSRANIQHYTRILDIYGKTEYPNPLVFITKRHIPEVFMDKAVELGKRVLFFISYSGLNSTGLELSVNERHQRDNFANLEARGLPRVHYWRPFLPQNSSPERIDDILSFVSQHATCSIVNGLRLNDGIRDNIAPFWPEIKSAAIDFYQAGEFWPAGVRQHLIERVRSAYPDYPVYLGNTPCSVACATNEPDLQGLFRGRMCNESNCLPVKREQCKAAHRTPSTDEITASLAHIGLESAKVSIVGGKVMLAGNVDTGKLVHLRYALRAPVFAGTVEYAGGHNWANVTDDVPIIEVPWRHQVDPYESLFE